MLWILFAFGSAFFAGITAVLAKIGIEHINSTLATAVRTVVVLAFSWLMVFVVGSHRADHWKNPAVFNPVRPVHRGLLAVLLQSLAAGGCKQGGAH